MTVRDTCLWRLRTQSLALGAKTVVMGILNLTPDSFSDGGRFSSPDEAIKAALKMLDDGAQILDLGAESTRPGSQAGGASPLVSAAEELDRLLPVVSGILRERPNAILSIDTYKAATAEAALKAGAEIINDVSGFSWDSEMPSVCAQSKCGVVLMHTRGKPDEWKTQEPLDGDAVLSAVSEGLAQSLRAAEKAGIQREAIVLDPGYGFGKRFEENYKLLARQSELLKFGHPLLAGVSRKSFLARTLAVVHNGMDAPVEQRESASLAVMVVAILKGATIVRVHQVKQAVEAALIADAVLENSH